MRRACCCPSVLRGSLGLALLLAAAHCNAAEPAGGEGGASPTDTVAEPGGPDEDWRIQPPSGLDEDDLEAYMEREIERKTKDLAEKRAAKKAERKRQRDLYDPHTMSNCDFSKPECWEDFYRMHPENFDWYNTPAMLLQPHLTPLGAPAKLLHVGSGSSSWTGSLADLPEVESVMNVDINQEVIDRMREQFAEDARLSFAVMDVMNMTFADGAFDAVVDKGLMDVFRPRGDEIVAEVFAELSRVLRPGGRLIYVSYAGPERQAASLQSACSVHPAEDKTASLYVCNAHGAPGQESPAEGAQGRAPDEL